MTAAIAVSVLAGPAVTATEASDNTRQQEVRERQCRFQWVDPGIWTAREERRTALCIIGRWPVSWDTLNRTIACESGWWRKAYNPNGHVGLGQHDEDAWDDRVGAFMPEGWRTGPWARWQNSRSNLLVTIRMAYVSGWGAWSCA